MGSLVIVRLQRSITWRPSARGRATISRKRGCNSGAPPVISSVGIACAPEARQASTTASGITSRPVGTGVDVAVVAGLVAALADVDLQHRDVAREGPRAGASHRLVEAAGQRERVERRALLGGDGQRLTAFRRVGSAMAAGFLAARG